MKMHGMDSFTMHVSVFIRYSSILRFAVIMQNKT
jgi:hypothetical protein